MFYKRIHACGCGSPVFTLTLTKVHDFLFEHEYEEAEIVDGIHTITDLTCARCHAVILPKDEMTDGEKDYLFDNDPATMEQEGAT